jgi:hypothetical protein
LEGLSNVRSGSKADICAAKSHVRFTLECVAKLFWGAAGETLIQHQTKMRNVDSSRRPPGFDCCALAMQQRVLQHIPLKSGHSGSWFECPLRPKADIQKFGSHQKKNPRFDAQNKFKLVCLFEPSHCHSGL